MVGRHYIACSKMEFVGEKCMNTIVERAAVEHIPGCESLFFFIQLPMHVWI